MLDFFLQGTWKRLASAGPTPTNSLHLLWDWWGLSLEREGAVWIRGESVPRLDGGSLHAFQGHMGELQGLDGAAAERVLAGAPSCRHRGVGSEDHRGLVW